MFDSPADAAEAPAAESAGSSRRDFSRQLLGSLLTFSLLETLFARDAFAADVKPITGKWLADLNQFSADVKEKPLDQDEWKKRVELLFSKVDMDNVLRTLDFDKLTAGLTFKDRGEKSLRATFPMVEGLPTNLVFGHQIFALGKDRSVVPHGHNNMATAFLILKGTFQGKQYDRLEDEPKHMIIQPTTDRAYGVGEYSTVTDFKDNVHWFKATSDAGFIFNIHVMDLAIGKNQLTGRIYIDPEGEKLAGGKIRAKKISSSDAIKLYG